MPSPRKFFLLSALAFLVLCAGGALAIALHVRAVVKATPVVLRNLPAPPPGVNSFVLTSPQGIRVFLDVVSVPDDLAPALDDPRNLFVVTHKHFDHYSARLADRFKGGKLLAEAGSLVSGDVRVEVVPSSHLDDEVDGHTDTLVVVDVGGVRVAHFGDCGQGALTPEQLARIGRVDLLIGQLENSYSDADVVNRKGFKVLAQVHPTLFVPTHIVSTTAVKLLQESYAPEQTPKAELALTPALLAGGKRAVFMGGNLPLATGAGVPASKDL
jgi:hypothetical protein